MPPESEHLPAARGRLFVVTLRLRGDLQAGLLRLTGSGFLGGVLHGAVRSRWFDLAGRAGGLSWRILAPPLNTYVRQGSDKQPDALHDLQFGILMHGGQSGLWHDAQRALESLTELGVGALRVPVLSMHCVHRPLRPLRPLQVGRARPMTGWREGQDAEPGLPASLALHWCTPLHLASHAKILAGHGGAPPLLLAVVRSLRRRVCMLEPEWADALGLGSDTWVTVEEALRRAQACGDGDGASRSRMHAVAWRYGSRTKSAPFLRHGLMGCQVFRLPTSASLLGLLSLGAWLGVGEGASFGCGQYRWRVRLADGQRASAWLPQPGSGLNGPLGLLGQNS